MKSKTLYILSLLICANLVFGQSKILKQKTFHNPTGTYVLDSKTEKRNGEIYGYFGTAEVILLDSTSIIMNFEVCKGAPSYNSGSFLDTLVYKDNIAVYTDLESDSTCRVVYAFTAKGIQVEQFSDKYYSACGFGHAVDAQGYYKKKSGKIPQIKELLKENK